MWYLVLVFSVRGTPALTSQLIPIGNETECTEKMKVFDNGMLNMKQALSPEIRALCIKGSQ